MAFGEFHTGLVVTLGSVVLIGATGSVILWNSWWSLLFIATTMLGLLGLFMINPVEYFVWIRRLFYGRER